MLNVKNISNSITNGNVRLEETSKTTVYRTHILARMRSIPIVYAACCHAYVFLSPIVLYDTGFIVFQSVGLSTHKKYCVYIFVV